VCQTDAPFFQRIDAIVEAFSAVHEDLGIGKEKGAVQKQWAKRGKQLEVIMHYTVRMWDELQGIVGKALQEIEGLDVSLLEEGDSESEMSDE